MSLTPEQLAEAIDAQNLNALPDDPALGPDIADYGQNTTNGPDIDPNEVLQYGQPAPMQQQVAAAPVINITSQEQFNALPDWQKEIIRAQARGVNLSQKVTEEIAKDAIMNASEQRFDPVILAVTDPVTNKPVSVLKSSPNSANTIARPEPTQLERVVQDDGTVMMIDPYSGKAFPAWNNDTGQPVRARVGTQEQDPTARLRRQSLQGKLDQANATVLDYEQRVARGDKSWMGLGGGYDADLNAAIAARDELMRQMAQLGPASSADEMMPATDMPPPVPTPTPRPTPQATPTPRPTPQATPTATPQATPAQTPRPTPQATPTATPTPQQTPTPPDPRPMPPPRTAGLPPEGSKFRQGGKTYIMRNGQAVELL